MKKEHGITLGGLIFVGYVVWVIYKNREQDIKLGQLKDNLMNQSRQLLNAQSQISKLTASGAILSPGGIDNATTGYSNFVNTFEPFGDLTLDPATKNYAVPLGQTKSYEIVAPFENQPTLVLQQSMNGSAYAPITKI